MLDGIPGRLVTASSAGRLTHVDLRVGKHGSTLAGLTETLSTTITTGLQARMPCPGFMTELRHTHYVPPRHHHRSGRPAGDIAEAPTSRAAYTCHKRYLKLTI
ncbi:hypothetical protein [Micromonospora sp. KC213]|uniref:hypothetical protein n=1 Tax=Micromonospora sp. KC213 TaxID=2530378 RepID=UPI00104D1C75|nr:hypothetical protein [Micromonospora sp. KC213]TDC43507.1 hypothetical protein E1166_03625 [Micromonospora sp. KC213]